MAKPKAKPKPKPDEAPTDNLDLTAFWDQVERRITTWKELADAIGISDVFLYQLRTGRRTPNLETFLKIDRELKVFDEPEIVEAIRASLAGVQPTIVEELGPTIVDWLSDYLKSNPDDHRTVEELVTDFRAVLRRRRPKPKA